MNQLHRPQLTPSLVDEAWFPRYDIDEEAMLEAEEADQRKAIKTIRTAKAVPYVGQKQGDADDQVTESSGSETDGTLSGSDDPAMNLDSDSDDVDPSAAAAAAADPSA